MNKPEGCKGCPFYGKGGDFVPDKIVDGSEVMVYAQNPGRFEAEGKRYNGSDYDAYHVEPMIGKTGYALDHTYLPVAGLSRDEISIGNAIRCRVNGKDDLPPIDETATRQAMLHCHVEHFKKPQGVKLIVAQGNYSLAALTQHWGKNDGIDTWRGYLLPLNPMGAPQISENDIWLPRQGGPTPVLATYHIAYTFRDPTASTITMHDFSKIQRILRGEWPKPVPPIEHGPPSVWPKIAAFDTEFVPENGHFICYSVYDGRTLRVSDKLDPGVVYEDLQPHVIMHNSAADLMYLEKMFFDMSFSYDDTMHAHAVLWSDFAHDLGFLGSLYSSTNAWKHLMHTNPLVYSATDAFVTWDVWEALKKEFKRDRASYDVYRHKQLKLVPIIRNAMAAGIRVNRVVAEQKFKERQDRIDSLNAKAQALVGWPINMRSPAQVGHELFVVEGLLGMVK